MKHLILSPHLDDAVLSLGAALHHWSQAGDEVLVVTICAGSPALPSYSRFARELHTRWGYSAEQAVARRRREDRAALKLFAEFLQAISGQKGSLFHGVFGDRRLTKTPAEDLRDDTARNSAFLLGK